MIQWQNSARQLSFNQVSTYSRLKDGKFLISNAPEYMLAPLGIHFFQVFTWKIVS